VLQVRRAETSAGSVPFGVMCAGRDFCAGRRRQTSLALSSADETVKKQVLYQGSRKISEGSSAEPTENRSTKGLGVQKALDSPAEMAIMTDWSVKGFG